MDVQIQSRERVFSILNDNDSPSFVIRKKPAQYSPRRSPVLRTLKIERPNLHRQGEYKRTSSISSTGSPPLLRFDSTSSKASDSSMDSTPSPITPAYNYNDTNLLPYDPYLRQDLSGYVHLSSPTNITPFMEQQLMITPNMTEQFPQKIHSHLTPSQYPILPAPAPVEIQQLPTPTSSSNSISTSATTNQSTASPSTASSAAAPVKKNKYPCPYAQSHNCLATFTTSGHAARHGKKHTGEKGVHCPVCNKAFTRKDNMKQHERTHSHKGSVSGSTSDDSAARRSKAAITRDAQKAKQNKNGDTLTTDPQTQKTTIIPSPLSEITSMTPVVIDHHLNIEESSLYPEASNPIHLNAHALSTGLSPNSLYPPIIDDSLLGPSGTALPPIQIDKVMDLNSIPMPPTLIRGFSDLDTLAQAAESFDPYYPAGV